MAENAVGFTKACTFEHGGPEQTMKIGDVFANEVIQLDLRVRLPARLPVLTGAFCQVAVRGDVANRRVQPHIKKLARRIRDLKPEVGRVARDVPVLQSGFQPLAELVGNFRLQGAAACPLAQHGGKVAERKEILLGVAFYRLRARDLANRIDKIGCIVGGTAVLAVVAVLILGAATRALALDVAIRQKHLALLVVELADGAGHDMASRFQALVDIA